MYVIYRWCPSVFFYLLSIVPAIWFLKLHQLNHRWAELVNLTDTLNKQNGSITSVDQIATFVQSFGVSIFIQMYMHSV